MWLSDFIKYVDNGTPIKVLYGEDILFEFDNAYEANLRQISGYIVYAVSAEDNTLILYVD